MAQGNIKPVLASVRFTVEEYARMIGPGGLATYLAPQDLLLVTDIYSLVMVTEASRFLKMHRLRAIHSYGHRRGELPGAHILDPRMEADPEGMFYKSVISSKSTYIGELVALATAQHRVALRHRKPLRVVRSTDGDPVLSAISPDGLCVLIGAQYAMSMLVFNGTECYSGASDAQWEPTESWKPLQTKDKGVCAVLDKNFYGLIMPHTSNAKIRSNTNTPG